MFESPEKNMVILSEGKVVTVQPCSHITKFSPIFQSDMGPLFSLALYQW